MKIIELLEDEQETYGNSEIVDLIKRDCKIFLDTKPSGLLYRGMTGKPNRSFKQSVRQDRRPRNMPPEVSTAIDNWFNENFGFKARSQGVFVTGEFDDARSYGKPFAVFPIGAFPFVWSNDVGDLFHLMHNVDPDEVASELDTAGYQDSEMDDAIKSGNEIMIGCKAYYAVPITSEAEGQFMLDLLTKDK